LHYNYGIAPQSIVDRVRRLEAHCEHHGVPLAAAALQFPLAHPQVVSVIPGLGSPGHIERTLELYKTNIPDAFWQDLQNEGLLRADAPVPVASGSDWRSKLQETVAAGPLT
jgi:D-threo-aldose 1-dehydrogenase